MVWLLVVIAVLLISAGATTGVRRRKIASANPDVSVKSLLLNKGFSAVALLRGPTSALAAEQSDRRLAIVGFTDEKVSAMRIVAGDTLVSCSVLRDDVPVATTARRDALPADASTESTPQPPNATPLSQPAQATRAVAANRATTTGLGAIVSGSDGTAQTNATLRLSRLALHITIDDAHDRDVIIPILELTRPEYLSAYWIRPQIAEIEQWYTRIAGIIVRADEKRAPAPPPAPAPGTAAKPPPVGSSASVPVDVAASPAVSPVAAQSAASPPAANQSATPAPVYAAPGAPANPATTAPPNSAPAPVRSVLVNASPVPTTPRRATFVDDRSAAVPPPAAATDDKTRAQ